MLPPDSCAAKVQNAAVASVLTCPYTDNALPSMAKARVETAVQSEQDVEEKTQREWLLQCPETYLGAVEVATWTIPVFNIDGTVTWANEKTVW